VKNPKNDDWASQDRGRRLVGRPEEVAEHRRRRPRRTRKLCEVIGSSSDKNEGLARIDVIGSSGEKLGVMTPQHISDSRPWCRAWRAESVRRRLAPRGQFCMHVIIANPPDSTHEQSV
jgi:hypothetical protein